MNLTVGISEMRISVDPVQTLITYSLGSCVGLAPFDTEAHVGGLIHSMLPFSKIDPEKAERMPCMFVDTGVPIVIISTEGGAARIRELEALGINAFLRKPFQPEALKKAVDAILGETHSFG